MSERSREKGADVETKRNGKIPPKWVDGFVYALILVLVVTPLLLLSLPPLIYLTQGGSVAETDINSADRVLSFLQGASVLIGGAVAVAAIYGFRNAQEVRKELREEMAQIRAMKGELEARLQEQIQRAQSAIEELQHNTLDLSEAYRDLLHRNYRQAYAVARSVLERDPENIQALYISGWMSMQFVRERTVDDAINDLEKALAIAQKEKTSPLRLATIRAALGVMYRRKGKKLKEIDPDERDTYFQKAKKLLLGALNDAPRMLDLYSESFYGPLGGLYRDMEQIDAAIDAYRKATEITPGSSYPWGNLAQLLWQKGEHDEAMRAFSRTYQAAQREQGAMPEDYYLRMDIAMSATVLKQFDEAQEALQEALRVSRTEEMLNTSLDGWKHLLESCPEGEDWDEVREHLQKGRDQVQTALAK